VNGIRLSLCAPGATAAQLVTLSRWADHWNLAGLWVGDPRGDAANADDSYVTAAAAAIAAVTVDLRLGAFLGLAAADGSVRIAEDVAVVDQASGGRLELALREGDGDWLAGAARFLQAWNAWPLPGRDETVAVLPGPAQPSLPRLLVGTAESADALGAGRLLLEAEPPSRRLVPPRTVLAISPALDDGVEAWLADSAVERVLGLRDEAAAAGAHELLLVAGPRLTEADVQALGTVVVPALRASARDAQAIAADAWTWLTRKRVLHRPPAPQR
jgi:alkanesulfonate monooxygenase SsuD/methylene tetrahydromethanopterin reductase-like flavin-dependent oxidoreductase (luciferase family)